VDRDGNVWVTVPLEKEVRQYGPDGKLLRSIRSKENPQATWDKPMGICLSTSGDALYVSDLAGTIVRLKIK
jgi:sugar lactone lactonase YvrE